MSDYKCQECGRKFKTAKAAERAADNGCPGCGGVDIDLDTETKTACTCFYIPGCGASTKGRKIHAPKATYNSLLSALNGNG